MKQNSNPITTYYDHLAPLYDQDRFANTYGHYIHQQENTILSKWLSTTLPQDCLDIGCGTGRFLQFAEHGIDPSKEMLKVAQQKYPQHQLSVAKGDALPFPAASFHALLCIHVLMHLSKNQFKAILDEAERVLSPKGQFIIDIPSQKRRARLNYQKSGWHGNTAYTLAEIKELCGNRWTIKASQGVLFLPIHRFPKTIRRYFQGIDNALCQSRWKEWSSYLFISLQKK